MNDRIIILLAILVSVVSLTATTANILITKEAEERIEALEEYIELNNELWESCLDLWKTQDRINDLIIDNLR